MARFDDTVDFNIQAGYDACAYSTLTPYPGTLTWYELKKANRIVSFDWTMYDQGQVVYRPAKMSMDELRYGKRRAYARFYSGSSMARRFPRDLVRHHQRGDRHRHAHLRQLRGSVAGGHRATPPAGSGRFNLHHWLASAWVQRGTSAHASRSAANSAAD